MTKTCLLLLALLAAGCVSRSAIEESREHARIGDSFRAFYVIDQARAERLRAGTPIDAEFAAAHDQARRKFLLERARTSIFLEREHDAMIDLAVLQGLAPVDPEVPVLRQRATEKLAARAAAAGDDYLAKGEYENALASYVEAERHVPGWKAAVEGAEKVRTAVGKMTDRAQQQFLEAVRKMQQFRYVEVRWHSANALTNDPTRADAELLRARSQREIAARAMARGSQCEQKEQFGAALIEYRISRALDASLPGIDEAIARMDAELKASLLSESAQMDMRLGRFESARKNLAQAYELSNMGRAGISELMIEARRLEGKRDYDAGRDLEIQGKKQEALAAYEAMGAAWPAGFQDEKVRIEGLRADIASAEAEWTAGHAAETAGDFGKALEHFLAAERFYAAHKDTKQRIASLRERLRAAGSAGTANGG